MSEHEFDAYLALLSGMLRLSKSQRESISGELRDHMLERMHDLVAAGVPRDEAIAKALEDFGDASRLATGLAAAAALERRRQIMRWTAGSIVTCGLLLFAVLTLWPSGENGPGPPAAQADPEVDAKPAASNVALAGPFTDDVAKLDDPNEITFQRLQKTTSLELFDMPLGDVIAFFKEVTDIQMIIDRRGLEDFGIDADSPVTIDLRRVPAMLALDLVLGQLGLGITIREGVVVITSADEADSTGLIRVYQVADLIDEVSSPQNVQIESKRFDLDGLLATRQEKLLKGDGASADAIGRLIIGEVESANAKAGDPVNHIIEVITTTVAEKSWDEVGGSGTIQAVGSALAIKNSAMVHWQIENFLTRLRRAVKAEPNPGPRGAASRSLVPTSPLRTPHDAATPQPDLLPTFGPARAPQDGPDGNPFDDLEPEDEPDSKADPFGDKQADPLPIPEEGDDPFAP